VSGPSEPSDARSGWLHWQWQQCTRPQAHTWLRHRRCDARHDHGGCYARPTSKASHAIRPARNLIVIPRTGTTTETSQNTPSCEDAARLHTEALATYSNRNCTSHSPSIPLSTGECVPCHQGCTNQQHQTAGLWLALLRFAWRLSWGVLGPLTYFVQICITR